MNVIVTGGSGYIGSHVVDALLDAGYNATNLDVKDGAHSDRRLDVDIRNVDALTEAMREYGRDGVFHVAGVANARAALKNPVTAVNVNVSGTASVLEAARRAEVNRVIFASTVWYYNAADRSPLPDGNGRVLDEDTPIQPGGPGHVYTTSKIAAELLCHDFQNLYDLDFTILRYGIPYGPRMWSGLVLRAFLDKVFGNEPIQIFGDGSATRRFVYVGDLAEAHVRALSEPAQNQIYNLEGERDVTIKELAETVRDLAGDAEIEYVVNPDRRGEMKTDTSVISNRKAEEDLGWRPTTTLEEGVERTIEWYKAKVLNAG